MTAIRIRNHNNGALIKIGEVHGEEFSKQIKARNIMLNPHGIAIEDSAIEDAIALGAFHIRVHIIETAQDKYASIIKFQRRGIKPRGLWPGQTLLLWEEWEDNINQMRFDI